MNKNVIRKILGSMVVLSLISSSYSVNTLATPSEKGVEYSSFIPQNESEWALPYAYTNLNALRRIYSDKIPEVIDDYEKVQNDIPLYFIRQMLSTLSATDPVKVYKESGIDYFNIKSYEVSGLAPNEIKVISLNKELDFKTKAEELLKNKGYLENELSSNMNSFMVYKGDPEEGAKTDINNTSANFIYGGLLGKHISVLISESSLLMSDNFQFLRTVSSKIKNGEKGTDISGRYIKLAEDISGISENNLYRLSVSNKYVSKMKPGDKKPYVPEFTSLTMAEFLSGTEDNASAAVQIILELKSMEEAEKKVSELKEELKLQKEGSGMYLVYNGLIKNGYETGEIKALKRDGKYFVAFKIEGKLNIKSSVPFFPYDVLYKSILTGTADWLFPSN